MEMNVKRETEDLKHSFYALDERCIFNSQNKIHLILSEALCFTLWWNYLVFSLREIGTFRFWSLVFFLVGISLKFWFWAWNALKVDIFSVKFSLNWNFKLEISSEVEFLVWNFFKVELLVWFYFSKLRFSAWNFFWVWIVYLISSKLRFLTLNGHKVHFKAWNFVQSWLL